MTSGTRFEGIGAWYHATFSLFLGHSPRWYKIALLVALILNPILLHVAGPFIAGWALLFEFICTLALALKCYPLQPGGLLAIESLFMGLASPDAVYRETTANFSVILLLMFMVAGIYFLRELLIAIFSKLFLRVRSKPLLAVLFCAAAAFLSAFLDALTVVAVVITVASGVYAVFQTALSSSSATDPEHEALKEDAERFRAFLRSIVMHAAVGTALGGVCTLVGEPQNLLIGKIAGWDFQTFAMEVAPVSIPVLIAGLLTCYLVERARWFGYGEPLPHSVWKAIASHAEAAAAVHDARRPVRLLFQAAAAALLIAGLALHVAEVGLIGLGVIIFATVFTGVTDEKHLSHAFQEALPFTALLVTFFAIVAVIHENELFKPIIDFVLLHEGREQLILMYLANGFLSAISDNVFVATVYMTSLKEAFDAGSIQPEQFSSLSVAVNTGTNIPSVATPNGQAAFLFLLTSALAPLIKLGYERMLFMALPYTVTMTIVGLCAVAFLL